MVDLRVDLLDDRASLLEGADGAINVGGDDLFDGVEAEVAAVGDLHAADGPLGGSRKIRVGLEAEGIVGGVAGGDVQNERCVLDASRERAFENERIDRAKGVRGRAYRHAAERVFETVDPA